MNTIHEKRLTTTTDHDMIVHPFDLRGRVRVQLLTKVAHRGVHVSQTIAEMRLFSENLNIVTSRS